MTSLSEWLLAGHLEFGDALVMNGLVRTFAIRYPQLVWLVNAQYVFSVRRMVADLPNVRVTGTCGYQDVKEFWLPRWPQSLRLGFFRPEDQFDQLQWDREFYRQADVDFECRWSKFRLAEPLPDPAYMGTLAHEDSARGYLLKRPLLASPYFIKPHERACILDWIPELLGARELHFIDSAFLNLAESLYALGQLRSTRLVFHRYAKTYPGKARWPTLRAPWEILT